MELTNVNKSVLTPIDFLNRSVLVYPDKTAVVNQDERYTYRELYQRVNRLACALKELGVRKGDKVAFICPNIPPMLEAHYAVPMIGAVLVSVNIRLSAGEVSYILDHSDASVVIVDSEFSSLVEPEKVPKVKAFVTVCDTDAPQTIEGMEYEAFLMTGSDQPVDPEIDTEEQTITMNYTSGTTGRPKGVMYHHRGAYLNALGEIIEAKLDVSSVYLWTLPMFHCNGWCFTWAVTAVGGTHVCLRNVVAGEI